MERSFICKLCYEEFGDNLRPRVLPCGHTYCTHCLDRLFVNGNLFDISCPRCKMNHRISSARDFSINYDLEECLLDARKAKPVVTPAPQSYTKVNRMQTIIAEQKPTIHNHIFSAEDMQTQLKGYDEFLLKRKAKHEAVSQKVHELASLHEAIVEEIKEERKRIVNIQKEGDGYYKNMNNTLPNLDTAEGNKAAGAALAEVFECLRKLEGWTDQCQQMFPYSKITDAEQILSKSLDSLSLVDSNRDENTPVASGVSSHDFTIMEQLDKIDEQSMTLVKLRLQPQRWRNRIAAGEVYAIRSNNGRKRSAKLSENDGRTYLSYLQDREAPVLAYTIEHSEVVDYLNKDSTVVFLDLGWDGSFKGRVHISLSPDTLLAHHFRILCTGELGPSYAHSKFLEVSFIGCNVCILGGDYEYNGVTSSVPLTSGLNKNDIIYRRQMEEGVVLVSPAAKDSEMAQFVIVIGSIICPFNGIFGRVQEGIEVLKDAVESRNTSIKEVEIINSGVQLSF